MDGKIGSAKITTLFPNVIYYITQCFFFPNICSSSRHKFLLLPIGLDERNRNGKEDGFKRVR